MYNDIKLHIVMPFEEQATKWPEEYRDRFFTTPDATSGSTWNGNYVYYGKYNSNPVKYRVLDPDSSTFGNDHTMFLDCDSILENVRFDNDGNANTGASKANEWAYSDLKKWLNNNFTGNLTSAESVAIASSTKGEKSATDGNGWDGTLDYAPLNRDKIFVLDAKEATNISYGYANTDNSDIKRTKNKLNSLTTYGWWLRSPNSILNDGCGCVNDDGGYIYIDHENYDDRGVSPAFNEALSSVLFSSVITSPKNMDTSDNKPKWGGEYKLTLLDNGLTKQSCYIAFLQALKGYDKTKEYKFTAYLSFPFKTVLFELLGCRTCKKNPLDECESLQQIIGGEDDNLLLIDTIKDENAIDIESLLDMESDGEVVREEVAKLIPMQRQVIEMHYFDKVDFSQIAKHFGLSYSRILQIRNKAFRLLRKSNVLRQLFDESVNEYHSNGGFLNPEKYYFKYCS